MDLFDTTPRGVGYGNAMFLADLAENVPDREMRQKLKAGAYPALHMPSVTGWRRMVGRSA